MRHNRIRDTLADLMREAGMRPEKEKAGLLPEKADDAADDDDDPTNDAHTGAGADPPGGREAGARRAGDPEAGRSRPWSG